MLNLEENITIITQYLTQKDLYIKATCYSTCVIIFLDLIRGQVPEINLLQLIPGFYLILLFLSFLILLFFSAILINFPLNLEIKKSFGIKTIAKLNFAILLKFSFFLLFFFLYISLNTVIPISLESFNTYGEKTLENLWSFNEVINLEIILLVILLLISQLPIFLTSFLLTEKNANLLPRYWKFLTLCIFIISGFLTPTIDGYTQLSFSFTAFSIYLIIINFLEKRVNIKITGYTIFGF